MKGRFLLTKNGAQAGEPDERLANIDGRAIMEFGSLTWRQTELIVRKRGNNLLKLQGHPYREALNGEKTLQAKEY
jgi:hypothetical protein